MSMLLLYSSGVAAPPASYPLSFSNLGLSCAGLVIDGTQAGGFYTDSGLSALCATADSDPVGGILDLSGNGTNLTQALSANRCLYRVNGGVQGYGGGTISGVNRWMVHTGAIPAAFTYYVVAKDRLSGPNRFGAFLSDPGNFNIYNDTGFIPIIYDGGSNSASPGFIGNPQVIRVVRTGTGANQTQLSAAAFGSYGSVYFQTTTVKASGTIYHNGLNVARENMDVFFEFYAEADIGATARATIEAYIAAAFTGVIS